MSRRRDPRAPGLVVHGMTSRAARRPGALDPAYARVDERTLADLLDFAVEVAPLVHYHAPTGERDGDWGAFFLDDPVMVMASLGSVPTSAVAARFAELERRALAARGETQQVEIARELVAGIVGLAHLVDRALRHLGPPRAEGATESLRRAIESAITGSLCDAIHRLRAHGAAAPGRPIFVPLGGLSPIWGEPTGAPHGRDDTGSPLGAVAAVFVDEIERLGALARAHFPAALAEGGKKPHLALYLAFAQLFQTAQSTLDRIPERHLDFYHRAVLREAPRGPVGDRAHLSFTLAALKGTRPALVPRGARFSAGKDADGVDIVFATERALRVGAARLERVRALSMIRGSLLPAPPGSEPPDEVALQVLAAEIDAALPFAPFGASRPVASGAATTSFATLGLLITSPHLQLSGGQRTLRVFFRLTAPSMAALRAAIDRVSAAAGAASIDLLESLLARSLRIELGTAGGPLPAPSYEVILDDDVFTDREIGLEIRLSPAWPALAPVAGASAPTLAVHLKQARIDLDLEVVSGPAISLLPLSLLADVEVEAVWLETEVTGLDALDLAGPAGAISAGQPFFPFGGAPGVGASLFIRHPEIFDRRPDRVGVEIAWLNLPPGDTGFAGHYRDYAIGVDGVRRAGLFDNRSFRVSLDVTGPSAFELGDAAAGLYLFRTEDSLDGDVPDPAGKLDPITTLAGLTASPVTRPEPYDPSRSAIRVSLIGPPEAFGDSVFAVNTIAAVTSAATEDTRGEEACRAALAPLHDAARLLRSAADLCGKRTAPADLDRCLSASIGACRGMLLDAALAASTKAAEEVRARLSPEAWAALDVPLAEAQRAAAATPRKEALTRFQVAYRAAAGAPEIGSAGWVGERLSEALLGVEEGGPGRATVANLVRWSEALDKAHGEGLEARLAARKAAPKDPRVPSAPWLPQARRVSLSFAATSVIVGAAPAWATDAERAGTIHHLMPFGDIRPCPVEGAMRLFPATDPGQSLLLGLRGISPAESLPILFHLAGTGDADAGPSAAVSWEILAGGEWGPLSITDGTGGLRRSGVATLRLPEQGLSGDLDWIRARVPGDAGRFPEVLGIHPYTVVAAWQPNGNSGAHLARPRPAGSITAPLDPLAGVASVVQPMPSTGGRPPETPQTMPVRVAERLRHKGRAVVGWDYERLALEQFPWIDRAITLPARGPRKGESPGEVTLVIVPGPDGVIGPDTTTPAASSDALAEVAIGLASRTSPFVELHVMNPVYVRITVTASVEVAAGVDLVECEARLDRALVTALSPWCADPPWGDEHPAPEDAAAILRADPAVTAVLDVRFDHAPDPADLDWYVLTSATSHRIDAVNAEPAEKGPRNP